MRCTLAEKLIPLFVSHDLPDDQMLSVEKHLESCAACRRLAAEFSESQLWLRTFAAPRFPEAIFDQLRDGVQKEIAKAERQSEWFEWLIPRWNSRAALATATAALLLVAAAGIYIWRSQPDRSSTVVKHKDENGAKTPSGIAPNGMPKPSTAPVKRRSAKPKSLRLSPPQQSPERMDVATTDLAADPEMLRIEFQTADPNIRIIWFAPKQDASSTH